MMNAEEAAAAKEEGVQSPIKKKSQIEGIDSNDRLKWGPELHEHFLQAVYRLGGPFATKPRDILREMNVPGLLLTHVKSHLQKHRLTLRPPANNYGLSLQAQAAWPTLLQQAMQRDQLARAGPYYQPAPPPTFQPVAPPTQPTWAVHVPAPQPAAYPLTERLSSGPVAVTTRWENPRAHSGAKPAALGTLQTAPPTTNPAAAVPSQDMDPLKFLTCIEGLIKNIASNNVNANADAPPHPVSESCHQSVNPGPTEEEVSSPGNKNAGEKVAAGAALPLIASVSQAALNPFPSARSDATAVDAAAAAAPGGGGQDAVGDESELELLQTLLSTVSALAAKLDSNTPPVAPPHAPLEQQPTHILEPHHHQSTLLTLLLSAVSQHTDGALPLQ